MKIAKSSWHYRFNNWSNQFFAHKCERGHYTTCSYVRTTIASMLSVLFKGLILLFLFGGFCFVSGSMIIVPIISLMGHAPYEAAAVFCVCGWIAAAFDAVAFLLNRAQKWIKNSADKENASKKEPSVFIQAIIDKHNKFCTLVKTED